jgi:hypothetical protein
MMGKERIEMDVVWLLIPKKEKKKKKKGMMSFYSFGRGNFRTNIFSFIHFTTSHLFVVSFSLPLGLPLILILSKMKLEVGVWKWRDTDKNAWIEYDSNNSLLLEESYILVRESLLSLLEKEASSSSFSSSTSSELELLKIQALVTLPGSPYRVEVFQMFQENLKTGFKRTVRRFPPPLPLSSISRRNNSSPSVINPSSLAYVFFAPSSSSSTRLDYLTKAEDGLELAPGEGILFLFPPSYYSSVISSVILAHRKSEDYLSSVTYKSKAPYDYEDQQGAYSAVFAHSTTPFYKRGPGIGKVMASALTGGRETEGPGAERRETEGRRTVGGSDAEGRRGPAEGEQKQEGETDSDPSSWLVWEDEYGAQKFAEPRLKEDPEIENLHDWESYLGILRANRIQVLSSGNPNHECATVNFHSLSVRFQPKERTTSVIEEIWSPGLKFRPWEGESTDMPLFRCTSRHLSHEVIEKEGIYPAAVCIGPLGYYHRKMPGAPSSSSSSSSPSSYSVFIPSTQLEEYRVGEEKFMRLRVKLPEGKQFHLLEVACGDTFIDPGKPIEEQKNKDGHYGTLGWARLWAKISSSSSPSSSGYFMENENVPPFGVLFGGPEAEAERIKAGDELLIESRRFPTWIMGYRVQLLD